MARRKKRDENQLSLFDILGGEDAGDQDTGETGTDTNSSTEPTPSLVPNPQNIPEPVATPPAETRAEEPEPAPEDQADPEPVIDTGYPEEPVRLADVQSGIDEVATDRPPRTGDKTNLDHAVTPPTGAVARAEANIAAIRTLRQLDEENRWATPAEQQVLAQYSSWGACAEIFDRNKTDWADRRNELLTLVDEDTYTSLQRTTLTAYYTPPEVVDAMWDGLRDAGLSEDGAVLEPGSGIGGFIRGAENPGQVVGVETDPIAAGIAQQLYPDATVRTMGFESVSIPDSSFSAAVGNVPFGRFSLNDRAHNADNYSIHDHFIVKSLDLVKPGGYAAFLTSTYTADSLKSSARRSMIDRADLVSAMRLPSQSFREVAGTDVTADLLVFRVRESGAPATDLSEKFVHTEDYQPTTGDQQVESDQRLTVNSVFVDEPDRVLGTPTINKGQFGQPVLGVVAGDRPLGEVIADQFHDDVAIAKTHNLGLTAVQGDDAGELADKVVPEMDRPIPGTIQYERTDSGLQFHYYDETNGWEETAPPRGAKAEEWAAILDLRDTTMALRQAYQTGDQDKISAGQQQLTQQYDAYVDTYGYLNREVLKPPRKPTKKKQEEAFQHLARQWRIDNSYAPAEPLPYEVEMEFREKAAEPTGNQRREQKHLSKLVRDPYIAQVLAIEDYDNESATATKAPIFTTNPTAPAAVIDHADSLDEAVAVSLNSHGVIDPSVVADLIDGDVEQVKTDLVDQGHAFRDPENPETFIRANLYLSGYVGDKLDQARQVALSDDRFQRNVEELKKVQPDAIQSGVVVTPGVNWIPTEYYTQFAAEKFDINPDRIRVSNYADGWRVEVDRDRWRWGGAADQQYGVVCGNNPNDRSFNFQATGQRAKMTNQAVACNRNDGVAVSAFDMYEQVLNLGSPTLNHSKEYVDENPGGARKHNQASAFASRKAKAMRQEFSDWVLEDPERRRVVLGQYNDNFNSYVPTKWSGEYREIPNLGEKFVPYDYQKNAVERIVNQPATLLNHVVGAGKTGTFFMGAAELKRLGKIKQPWIVVPNHLAEQITAEAIEWYPEAEVLSAAGVSSPEQRRRFVAQTTAADWDFVVVPQSVFERVGMSREVKQHYMQAQLAEARTMLSEATDEAGLSGGGSIRQSDKPKSVKQIEGIVASLETRLEKLLDQDTDEGLTFEDTACDYLVVDEAHMYKNLQRTSKVEDISHPGSNRASDLHMKMSYLRDSAAQRGLPENTPVATFATGTPLSNNLAEIWVMAKFLRPDLLEHANIGSINAWATTFTESQTAFEVNATGTGMKQTERTANFINTPELAGLCSNFMDVVTRDQITANLPEMRDNVVEFTVEEEVSDFIADLAAREAKNWADAVSGDITPEAIDNALKQLDDARKVSLHPKLANLEVDGPGRRVSAATKNIMSVWNTDRDVVYQDSQGNDSATTGSFQIVFCDRGVPSKTGFSVYDAIKDDLIAQGMPAEQIQFVHDWDKDREGLFERCRNGKVSVLIGSTEKLGTGANIQTRCRAIHHLDVPWTPADNEQRDGRGWRQGNQNSTVDRYRYIAAGTSDAIFWQTVTRKAKFIEAFENAGLTLRGRIEAIGDSEAEAAAYLKAIATGDTRYVELEDMKKAIGELESQRNEWKAAEENAKFTQRYQQGNVDRGTQFIAQAQPYVDSAEQWDDNKIWTTPAGQVTDDRSQAARQAGDVIRDSFISRSQEPQSLGKIGDVEFSAHYNPAMSAVEVVMADIPHSGTLRFDWNHIEPPSDLPEDGSASSKQYGMLTRMENRMRSLPIAIDKATVQVDKAQEEIDRIAQRESTGFAAEGKLDNLRQEKDALEAELQEAENSPEAKQREQQRQQRLTVHGREPVWTLRLNPTKAYAEEIEGKPREEVVAGAKRDDYFAQCEHGLIDESERDLQVARVMAPIQPDPVEQVTDFVGDTPQATTPTGEQTPPAHGFGLASELGMLDANRPITNGDGTGHAVQGEDSQPPEIENSDEDGQEL